MSHDAATHSLHVSANQWRVSMLKACVGCHVPRGIAEDVADAGLALLASGRQPLDDLLACLNGFSPASSNVPWPKTIGPCALGKLQVLHHGPSVIDLVQAGATPSLDIDSPLLLLGLAQARLQSHGAAIDVCQSDGQWVTAEKALKENNNLGTLQLRLSASDAAESNAIAAVPQPSRAQWQELQDLAAKILVPADATSREDAGVGDGQTDND